MESRERFAPHANHKQRIDGWYETTFLFLLNRTRYSLDRELTVGVIARMSDVQRLLKVRAFTEGKYTAMGYQYKSRDCFCAHTVASEVKSMSQINGCGVEATMKTSRPVHGQCVYSNYAV